MCVLQIAIEGCGHGELDNIYASLALAEQRNGIKVDLLLICGDFQAVRNQGDLATMACPVKYRQIGNFYKYYSGEKVCARACGRDGRASSTFDFATGCRWRQC